MMKGPERSKGAVGKGLKRKEVEGCSAGSFIQRSSGGGPVHASCPIWRAPNWGWRTEIMLNKHIL